MPGPSPNMNMWRDKGKEDFVSELFTIMREQSEDYLKKLEKEIDFLLRRFVLPGCKHSMLLSLQLFSLLMSHLFSHNRSC